jgi:hypothetical protein
VRQLLHALGVRRRRLRPHHLKANPEAQAAVVADLASLLAKWPADGALLCVDAATRRRHPTLTAPWGLVADVPAVPTGADQTRGQVDGAVAPLTGRTHDHVSPTVGKGECATFRPRLLAYSPAQRLRLIHDRGEQPQGAPVEALSRGAGGRLELRPQPAYSPELKPQERIGKWWRRVVTHHHWVATLGAPIEAVRKVFRYLAGVKDQGLRLWGLKTPESFVASL